MTSTRPDLFKENGSDKRYQSHIESYEKFKIKLQYWDKVYIKHKYKYHNFNEVTNDFVLIHNRFSKIKLDSGVLKVCDEYISTHVEGH